MREDRQQRRRDWYTERKLSRIEGGKAAKLSGESATTNISVGGVLSLLSGRNERTHQ